MGSGFVQTLESPGIKMLRFRGLESPGKRHRSWKTLEKSWNSKVVVQVTIVIAFGLVYCNEVTPITDLICALFGPYAAMFVNRSYPGKSLKTSFVSPGKPWNLVLQVLESPGKQYFAVCTNPVGSCSVTCHPAEVPFPPISQTIKAGTQFSNVRGMQSWVDLVGSAQHESRS